MFSGIVAEVGTVEAVSGGSLRVRGGPALLNTAVGGSVAVNGVCLTATRLVDGGFEADVMPETLRRTSLAAVEPGARVNLEPALAFGAEVGGHLVQGHVDATGEVVATRDEGNARWVEIRVPADLVAYCVVKGSLAIDGTSLTIAGVDGDVVAVSLIPHTLESTIAAGYQAGTLVNLEVDILAKYVAHFLAERGDRPEAPSRST
ncbi:MAG: riboflavin synthase [Candidatus Dormibacteraeota bacterium]|nr:riboflavin synthase [Candidatus Dormibacteraeota bacterium]